MKSNSNPQIKWTTESKVVGEVYNDAWNDGYVRVDFKDQPPREMEVNALQALIDRRGWKEEVVGPSGNTNLRLYDEKIVRVCRDCDNDPLYDSSEEEWYCPRCE